MPGLRGRDYSLSELRRLSAGRDLGDLLAARLTLPDKKGAAFRAPWQGIEIPMPETLNLWGEVISFWGSGTIY